MNGFLLPVILSKIVSAKSRIESKGLEEDGVIKDS